MLLIKCYQNSHNISNVNYQKPTKDIVSRHHTNFKYQHLHKKVWHVDVKVHRLENYIISGVSCSITKRLQKK